MRDKGSRAAAPAWGCEARLELDAAGSVNRLKASRVGTLPNLRSLDMSRDSIPDLQMATWDAISTPEGALYSSSRSSPSRDLKSRRFGGLGGWGLGRGWAWYSDFNACKESLAPFVSWLEPTRLAFNKHDGVLRGRHLSTTWGGGDAKK